VGTGNPEVDLLGIKTVYPEIDRSYHPPSTMSGRRRCPEAPNLRRATAREGGGKPA
jgi:hypothetical protein